ncbi:endo-1,4-beta-xylanase [Shewanella sp. 6_MG-2023]|uniref:endo-1,4-beta-xylanase n=1 Tax=Shewanella sp. 6_MG-2023 TaxID=3062660 RepID=UPI0026E42DAF|nr:endo-1,4-beta-xylanase [Shewanella sp. 6_MG-2023]MDO6618315.1 endo-1,4-beta-xylanase [Shewanella sp. 6_MG-2023]
MKIINKFNKSLIAGCATVVLALSGCNSGQGVTQQTKPEATATLTQDIILKNQFAENFKIGTAISKSQVLNPTDPELLLAAKHFNTFTPENSMKWESVNPLPNEYQFEVADALVNFAKNNNQQLVGHTLVWHSQTPDWVFEDDAGNPLNREQLLKVMEIHIKTVAGRYADQIFAWDVVNEALNEDGSLRESKWQQIIGDDFIEQAFIYAHQAAPNAKLYYNDYNMFKPEKRAGAIALIKRLKQKGIQIDGVGMQAHYSLDYPDFTEVEDSIVAFAAAGVDVMVTELDISVLPFPENLAAGADVSLDVALQQQYNPYAAGLPIEVEQQLASRYQNLFALYKKHSDSIGRITFWGVSDKQTWRNGWPMAGRTDYPLLIDRDMKLKAFVNSL